MDDLTWADKLNKLQIGETLSIEDTPMQSIYTGARKLRVDGKRFAVRKNILGGGRTVTRIEDVINENK